MTTLERTNSTVARLAATKHHGLPLLPQPTRDPRDPLRTHRGLKLAALGATAFTNFTANFAGAGLSVATPQLQAQFGKSPNEVNWLLTFNFLLLGIGNLFWVPLGAKYGKRASLLVSTLMLFAVLIWTAKEAQFTALLAARCLSGFASAAGESIVPGIVSDLFFLHERATMMSVYTILASTASALGPLIASFIVQYSPGGWRDFVWVCAALAGANALAIFFLYPETNFARPTEGSLDDVIHPTIDHNADLTAEKRDLAQISRVENISRHNVDVVPKSWLSIWTTFLTVDHQANLFQAFLQPLIMLFKPEVLLAVFIYGTSLASQVILIFAFPSLLLPPPYLFSPSEVGMMQIAGIIGFLFACLIGGYVADVITAAVIKRQAGRVFPAQRLIALASAFWVSPAGCILIAFACSEKLQWVSIAFGFSMLSFGTVFSPNIAVTYVIETYPKFATESLVAINVFKNLVAFLFLYYAIDWVISRGWVQVYMIMFMLVLLSTFLSIPLYFYGQRSQRRFGSSSASA